MLSRMDSRKRPGEKSGNGKLLNDIESISKALYLDKTQPRLLMSTASSRSKSVGKARLQEPTKSKNKDNNGRDSLEKDSNNKKSIWSWKSLKSLTQVKNRHFNCSFSLQVHCVEGLPTLFDDLSLIVHWKRRDGELMTCPVIVREGIAEFEEQLSYVCSVYGSRSGPHHSAKYEAKHCLLYASVYGTPELDLGKHRVDLTRFLPLTLEELEDERSSGKWTTSFKLSGKAKGATMNVSFGYLTVGNGNSSAMVPLNRDFLEGRNQNFRQKNAEQSNELSVIRRGGSVPSRSSTSQQSAEDVKDLHEVLPLHHSSDLSKSVEVLYQKLEEEKSEASVDIKSEIDAFSNTVENLKPELALLSDPEKQNVENEYEVTENVKPELALLSDPEKGNVENDCEVSEFSVIERGIELPLNELEQKEDDSVKIVDGPVMNEDLPASASNFETDESVKELLLKELEFQLNSVSDLANEALDPQEHDGEINHDSYLDAKTKYRELRKGKSLSMDYINESVASDFLDMLGIEHSPLGPSSESEPDSPRERLLRQFEKETLASGCSLFNLDMDIEEFTVDGMDIEEFTVDGPDFGYSSATPSYEKLAKIEIEETSNKARACLLEDLETEALMREWGMSDKSFEYSPKSSSGFGSPIHMMPPPEEPYQLPPLGEGLGPLVQTKDGGFLRSMNPAIFKNAKSGGSLIMQVSSPVVVPAEMGSGITDILQHLASIGIEKLSMQASKLMPLEDITGRTVEQIAWESALSLEEPSRQDFTWHEFEFEQSLGSGRSKKGKSSVPMSSKLESGSAGSRMDSEYVSLEDLAPLAMDKIEALSIEGLRVQTGMSDEDVPSNVTFQSIGEFSAFEGQKGDFGGAVGLEGAGGLKLMDIKDNGDDVDGLMGFSLTLDEWMKLDSGEIGDEEDEISERTSKLLAAHHATSMDLFRGRSKGEKRRGKGKKCGLLGNNFTVALLVQLRDPLRNYEPVGTPMLALVQVERVFVPPKPKIYSTVSELRSNSDEKDDESEPPKKDTEEEKVTTEVEQEQIPQYKIAEVHVAGLKMEEPGKKKLWGNTTQQQSGSRWLLANGMGKKNKHPIMKSKAGGKSLMAGSSGDKLWSMSLNGRK